MQETTGVVPPEPLPHDSTGSAIKARSSIAVVVYGSFPPGRKRLSIDNNDMDQSMSYLYCYGCARFGWGWEVLTILTHSFHPLCHDVLVIFYIYYDIYGRSLIKKNVPERRGAQDSGPSSPLFFNTRSWDIIRMEIRSQQELLQLGYNM